MNQPNDDDSVPAEVFSELDQVIKELKTQVEVNRRLARELINVRLELEQLKLQHSK